MLRTNIRNLVRQTQLPKWKPLLPVFEAVMNSFQAIRDVPRLPGTGKILIEIERDHVLLDDESAPIRNIKIIDNGVGLNDLNMDSFNESYTEHKLNLGGKGLGRFTWLKAFERVEIESYFREPDEKDHLFKRKFVFDENYEPDHAAPVMVAGGSTGTAINLVSYKEPYKGACPRTTDQFVQRILEHFLLIFLEPNCPSVIVQDQSLNTSANDVFEKEFKSSASITPFQIGAADFTLTGFKLTTPRVAKHKLVYAANQRGVVSDKLEDYIPNLSGRIHEPNGSSFVYLGIVQGAYLTQRVNAARTDFDFANEDAEAEPTLFSSPDEIKRADIRNEAVRIIENELADTMKTINEIKEERVQAYVQADAPQYKILMKYSDEFISKISPDASKPEIEAALHHELYQREARMRQESGRIIKEAEKVSDYEEYRKRFAQFMEDYNEIGASALAQYVAHRRIILDFLERAIERTEGATKFPLESVVHQLVYPMKHNSDDLLYSEQNLWMIDERLTYHSFIASDPTLSNLDRVEIASGKRPDVFIFDQQIVFGEGETAGIDGPVTSLTLVEFKRPQRDNYTSADNPVKQCFDLVRLIRRGKFKNAKGRPISTITDKIPAYCYIIADIMPSLVEILESYDAYPTPDNQGYYGFQKTFGIYYEVSGYDKLLRDARKRNRIFFDKLNILARPK
jgi:hypothetical protein